MLTKFETKSNRVKGLSFHPKRSAERLRARNKLTDIAVHVILGVLKPLTLSLQALDPCVTSQRCDPGRYQFSIALIA